MSIEDRPPYLEFSRRAVEDRALSVEKGHYVSKDVDFVAVQRPGSRDIHEEEAVSYLKKYEEKVRAGLAPVAWLAMFKTNYDMWKSGQEAPAEGTSLKAWPLISPAQCDNLIRMKVRTVEDLANLPEGELSQLGMGVLGLRIKAKEWLNQGSEKGVLIEKIAELTRDNQSLAASLQKLAEEFKTMKDTAPKEKAF